MAGHATGRAVENGRATCAKLRISAWHNLDGFGLVDIDAAWRWTGLFVAPVVQVSLNGRAQGVAEEAMGKGPRPGPNGSPVPSRSASRGQRGSRPADVLSPPHDRSD